MAPALKVKAKDIRRIARAHGVIRLRVFRSHVSGKATKPSDLDLLVGLKPGRDLLDLIGFKLDLEEALGCRVDVVTESGLSPYLSDRMLRGARPL
jgi:predicted nucleotidyltransferase